MRKLKQILLLGIFISVSYSCQTMLEVMQGMSTNMSSSYSNYNSVYSTPTTSASSSEREWHKCSSCYGTGICQSCNGTGKSGTRDGKCHACDRTGNGKCPGCHGKGGYYV